MGEETRLRAVAQLAHSMAGTAVAHGLPEVAHAAAASARRALGGCFATVSVWEPRRGLLRVMANDGELGPDEEPLPTGVWRPARDFPEVARVLHEGWARGGAPQAWVETADGVRSGRGYGPPRAAELRRRGRGCCVVAPIVLHERPWGELSVARAMGQPLFDGDDAAFVSVLAAVIAAGVVQHERLARARELAFTDSLTGLGNRRAVETRLAEGLAEHEATGAVLSLVVCDVNGLKRINDTYGHATGDRLLQRFGAVLSRCGTQVPGALAARLGGDEFCLLVVGPPTADVVQAAEEVCRRAGELALGEGVACGVASTGEPIGAVRSARRLFRLADAAQYQAKTARSGRPVVAGRGTAGAAAVRLADAPEAGAEAGAERRRFRGDTQISDDPASSVREGDAGEAGDAGVGGAPPAGDG